MVSENQKLHVMFLPYIAPGHMVPMVDMARLFAANGIRVTIILTTMNARRFQNAIDRDSKLGREISIKILCFPSKEVGLPEGCENLISTPTPESTMKLFPALELLRPEMENIFREQNPNCIASDSLFPWTVNVAEELGIPRLAFTGSGFFNNCVSHSLEHHEPFKNIESETQKFSVPGLPDQVILSRSQLPDIVKCKSTAFSAMFDELNKAERKSFGVLMNSFYELEPAYADHFRKVTGKKAWHIGPVSLYNRDVVDKAERGDKACVSKHSCLSWLDSRKPNSVLYICFGSLTRFSKEQTTEIAAALIESGYSFIWVVGKNLKTADDDQEDESWLPDGFEDEVRRNDKGLIIKGWAPQVLILEHKAIGGFLTHCGWNSILEGVSAGIPMVTWPVFAEQFNNEKLVTQVLKFGVPVGNEIWKIWATQDSPLIIRKKIKNAICAVIDNDDQEAVKMRKKANHLKELAKKAVEEGGSSCNDLKALIEDIRLYKRS